MRAASSDLAARRARVEALRRALGALGPLATLDRGFAIATRPDGAVIEDAQAVALGDTVQVRLRRGALLCRVHDRVLDDAPGGDSP